VEGCDCGYMLEKLASACNHLNGELYAIAFELRDLIDGGEECRGRDAALSRLIERIDRTIIRPEPPPA
jgi:hypothetical protein